jgi:regulator of sirC expression with transglutaminase-like and TPR domain
MPPTFAELAVVPDPPLDALALAIAGASRPVDYAAALAQLDAFGEGVAAAVAGVHDAEGQAAACARVLGAEHGFTGDRQTYDDPRNSMLDIVLERRRGLPILLSVVYVEAGRRAGLPLAGVGLPGHFVVGHFGTAPALLLDPFAGGTTLGPDAAARPWTAHEIAMRILNNLVGSYQRRGFVDDALRVARMRMALPANRALREMLHAELRALEARLN